MRFLLKRFFIYPAAYAAFVARSLLVWFIGEAAARGGLPPVAPTAVPTGGSVAQGSATINTSGSSVTINQTSGNAVYNWSSFNIGSGASVTFDQPSGASVAWNNIGGASASQIFGSLNANGFVVLQNANGFYIGGSANINTHGLVLSTASTPNLNLSSGGAWEFDSPPPTASIINYGQINVSGGGALFLIANDIENRAGMDSQNNNSVGSLSAPGGKIGLYAGQQVLVSMSPDGRGLSARVTLPQGSVDNAGRLTADGGSIIAQAQTVNNNGLVQANSVQTVNGVIELVAGGDLSLGANSDLEANGDATAGTASPGGFAVLQAGNSYADTATSKVNVSGQNGGQNGIIEVFGQNLADATSLQSQIGNNFAFLVNPYDLTLSTDPTEASGSPNLNVNDLAAYSQIDLHALDNIEVSTSWYLNGLSSPAILSLTAGNNIIVDNNAGIGTGNNWSVNLTAGAALAPGSLPASGNPNNGIYLNGNSYIGTVDGDIDLWAANEIMVDNGAITTGIDVSTGSGPATGSGGSINATAVHGDVNTGYDVFGYDFGLAVKPYYSVDPFLGGISTAAGGNVTINAGGNVISFLPIQTANPQDYSNAQYDGGSGAFGPEAGNVTIKAGGNVYGHYVVANGVGTITAGGNVGAPISVLESYDNNNNSLDWQGFALSLIKGSWNVAAPNGSIYVQDLRNPNGIFGEYPGSSANNYPGYHYFDYDPNASVSLDAGDAVEFTGYEAPHLAPSNPGYAIPFLLPPVLNVIAGAGGFILDTSVIMFPSPDQGLTITTHNGGNFGIPNSVDALSANPVTLEMSDSAATSWTGATSFTLADQPASSTELADPNPVRLDISGSMNAVNLYATEAAQITVHGDMINSGLVGENLHSSDVTSINVTGKIYDSPNYTFVSLGGGNGIVSANPLQPGAWDSVFDLAIDPTMVGALANVNTSALGQLTLASYLKQNNYLLFPSGAGNISTYGVNPGFVYDSTTHELGFSGSMSRLSAAQIAALESGTITVLAADQQGNPIVGSDGRLETITYHFSAAPFIAPLYAGSLNSTTTSVLAGLQIGGPGTFTVSAASIDLGDSAGIGSAGFGNSGLEGIGFNYSSLKSLLPDAASGGASVTVDVVGNGNLTMATSGIFSRDGGDVTVSVGGEIDLSQGSFVFPTDVCYGIYTAGHSDVSVTAGGDINIGSSRIATFDGGNVTVTSLNGDVNAGNGGNIALLVYGYYTGADGGSPAWAEFGDLTDPASLRANPAPYGSGILAEYPTKEFQTSGGNGMPGNITVQTPKGNINSTSGGISQFALAQNLSGPIVTLDAGTPGVTATADQGNVFLGDGGVVGGTIDITSQGKVDGLIVSRQNANISAVVSFSGTVLSGGIANFSGGGSVAGTVVGIGGINVSGNGAVTATMLSQSVSAGGITQSTLGSSAGATAASQSAAGVSSTDTKQQLAATDNGAQEDEKKKQLHPLVHHVKRVTVILPNKL
jgi:filamentous hemagglutinin family protein